MSILIGTTVLAIAANSYELLCTAGLPLVFTRVLTLNDLSTPTYYGYLVLYNVVYVVPLLLIVAGFVLTLGRRKLQEAEGRFLKLMSGLMMLGLDNILGHPGDDPRESMSEECPQAGRTQGVQMNRFLMITEKVGGKLQALQSEGSP